MEGSQEWSTSEFFLLIWAAESLRIAIIGLGDLWRLNSSVDGLPPTLGPPFAAGNGSRPGGYSAEYLQ